MKKLAILILVLFFFVVVDNPIPKLFQQEARTLVVGIQPFEDFSPALIDTVNKTLQAVYGFDVSVLPSIKLPKSAFTTLRNRKRYRADSLIRYLRQIRPDSVDYIIGLTRKDISTTKRGKDGQIKKPASRYVDWGIFGLGFRPGPSCIVSNYRLKLKDKQKYHMRLKKICMHEIGHNLGLPHCADHPKCVMRDAAETIKTIDNVDLWLCDSCKRKIKR